MEERRERHFRISLLGWVLLVNLALKLGEISWGWVIFISNILLFTMGGDLRKNFVSVELGGLAGLLFAYGGVQAIAALTPVMGEKAGIMVVLTLVLWVLLVWNPKAPRLLNNAGFAYFTCAMIDVGPLVDHFILLLLLYGAGTLLVNGVSIGLLEFFNKQ